MKFFFLKTDSLYKIFKALEKIPSHRDVEIFIDPEHNLFDNEWRWQQIKEIIDKNQIKAVFVAKNKKNREYLESVWLNVSYEREKHIEKFINKLYLFFFNIKNFHLHTYENKKIWSDILFMSLANSLIIFWIFLTLGDSVIWNPTDGMFAIRALSDDSALTKFDGVYPIWLFISFWVLAVHVIISLLSIILKKNWMWMWWILWILIVLNVAFLFQSYPRHWIMTVWWLAFDIKQYASFIVILHCIITAIRRDKKRF